VRICPELKLDAKLYLFFAPNSYNGEDVAEIHIYTNSSVTEVLLANLLDTRDISVRMAGPGEFTARAYLNGKMDLTQAEAVNEIIVSSNRYQLAASEKLLAGRLAQTVSKARAEIMDCLGLLEAGLDFSGEDIEFITPAQAVQRLGKTKGELEQLNSGSITYEQVVDLPAVGIAGATNAGKSSLLNILLGQPRSIVSDSRKTTRDVLTGTLTLEHTRCIIFDCAGLVVSPSDILDALAQQAAVEALRNSSVVLFCVDVSKDDYNEDVAIRKLFDPRMLIAAATRSDLLAEPELTARLSKLRTAFGCDFIPISSKTGNGLKLLCRTLDKALLGLVLGQDKTATLSQGSLSEVSAPALTARHKKAMTEAMDYLDSAAGEILSGNDEVAAMMLRGACRWLSGIEQQNMDDQVLEQIFSRFCIGK
jgi:tRNA modification GTPase